MSFKLGDVTAELHQVQVTGYISRGFSTFHREGEERLRPLDWAYSFIDEVVSGMPGLAPGKAGEIAALLRESVRKSVENDELMSRLVKAIEENNFNALRKTFLEIVERYIEAHRDKVEEFEEWVMARQPPLPLITAMELYYDTVTRYLEYGLEENRKILQIMARKTFRLATKKRRINKKISVLNAISVAAQPAIVSHARLILAIPVYSGDGRTYRAMDKKVLNPLIEQFSRNVSAFRLAFNRLSGARARKTGREVDPVLVELVRLALSQG